MLSRLRAHLPLWRRALRRRRRLLAALALAALLAALLPSLLPPSTRGVEVVVAGSSIAAGDVLAEKDLRTARVAPSLVPEDAPREMAEVIGRTARLPLSPGTPLLPGLLEESAGTVVPDGTALIVVPVPTALAPHLGPGSEVALLSTDPAAPSDEEVLARVVEIVPPGGGPSPLGGGAGTTEALVAVDRSQADQVARGLGTGSILVTVVGS